MSRRHVLVLSDVFPPRPGGSGRWLWELYRRLPGIDVSVIAGDCTGAAEFDRAASIHIERMKVTFPSWGVRALASYVRLVNQAARRAKSARVDVVHCGKCLPEGLAGLLLRWRTGLPYWCFAHGEELTLARTSRELTWLTTRVLRHAAGVVANSEHTKRLLLSSWPDLRDRIVVLHPGVDTARFVPAPLDDRIRARLGWTGKRVMLTVGALQQRKGQDMVIRALPAIRQRCPDVLYAMAGEGWERQSLERLATDLGVRDVVQFIGTPADDAILELYQQCDLFVLANRQVGWDFEGFGIVLIEAQACGNAVVTGASGGTTETVQPGVTGEVVACDTPEPLAEHCVTLLGDATRRASYGTAARAWAVARFDWEATARRAHDELHLT